MLSKIGILLNWKPKEFDLDVARKHIKKKTKFAWLTGGIQLRNFVDNDFLDETILGFIKESGQDEIKYGVTIDASKEFREYLKPHTSPKKQLHEKHKKYRPFDRKDNEAKAFLFISDIFLLKNPIEFNKIKLANGNVFDPRIYRSAVFFDIKKSGFNAEEILDKKKDFDDYLGIEEDEQTGIEFKFSPGCPIKKKMTTGTKEAQEIEIDLRHRFILEQLYERLEKKYDKESVGTENITVGGNRIDVVVKLKDELIYYEIKTASNVRMNIRESLSQLLEYSYWPRGKEASKLIIIGETSLDEEAERYLITLREKFSIPIYYEQFKID